MDLSAASSFFPHLHGLMTFRQHKKKENSSQGPLMADLRFTVNCDSLIKEMLH